MLCICTYVFVSVYNALILYVPCLSLFFRY